MAPHPADFEAAFVAIKGLEFSVKQFRETIECSMSDDTYSSDLSTMAKGLELMAYSLDQIKLARDAKTTEDIKPDESPELDDLVTLDQVAPLTGLQKRTLERYLSKGDLPQPDIRGGGGKAHKWFYSNLRDALSEFTQRSMPERFPAVALSDRQADRH